MTATTNDREFRLRRSLKRLGCDLVDADAGAFYIRHQGKHAHGPTTSVGQVSNCKLAQFPFFHICSSSSTTPHP